MPIKPEDVIEVVSVDEVVEMVCEFIDARLKTIKQSADQPQKVVEGNFRTFDIELPKEWDPLLTCEVMDKVQELYIDAGWSDFHTREEQLGGTKAELEAEA
jgi:hypothetical protein